MYYYRAPDALAHAAGGVSSIVQHRSVAAAAAAAEAERRSRSVLRLCSLPSAVPPPSSSSLSSSPSTASSSSSSSSTWASQGVPAAKFLLGSTVLRAAYVDFASRGQSLEEQRMRVHMPTYAVLTMDDVDAVAQPEGEGAGGGGAGDEGGGTLS